MSCLQALVQHASDTSTKLLVPGYWAGVRERPQQATCRRSASIPYYLGTLGTMRTGTWFLLSYYRYYYSPYRT